MKARYLKSLFNQLIVFMKTNKLLTEKVRHLTNRLCLVLFTYMLLVYSSSAQFGNIFVGNGTDAYVQVPDNSAIDLTDNFTAEAWINPATTTGVTVIVSKQQCSDKYSFYMGINNGKLVWNWQLTGSTSCSSTNQYTSGVTINTNVWTHVAVAHTHAGVTMYINGEQDVTASLTSGSYGTVNVSVTPMRIGAYQGLSGSFGNFFNGGIDDVRLWNIVRTQAQIQASMNTELAGTETGLAAYYVFDQIGTGAGQTVANNATAAGTALNGITTGNAVFTTVATFAGAYFNNALSLDGTVSYVEVPDNSALHLTDNITIEAWVKPCSVTDVTVIVSKQWCAGGQSAFYLSIDNGKLKWVFDNDGDCSTAPNIYISNNVVLTSGTWTHVAVVHKSTGVQLYVDGTLVPGTLTGSNSTIAISQSPMRIGAYQVSSGSFGNFFNGLIDEVRIWNTAHTATQISSLMNKILTGSEANLTAYYAMNNSGVGQAVIVPNSASATASALNGTTIGNVFAPALVAHDNDVCGANLRINQSGFWDYPEYDCGEFAVFDINGTNAGTGLMPLEIKVCGSSAVFHAIVSSANCGDLFLSSVSVVIIQGDYDPNFPNIKNRVLNDKPIIHTTPIAPGTDLYAGFEVWMSIPTSLLTGDPAEYSMVVSYIFIDEGNNLNTYSSIIKQPVKLYVPYNLETATPLGETDNTWAFASGDYNADTKTDIVGIRKSGSPTNATEVHVLDGNMLNGSSNFQDYILETVTALGETGDNVVFSMGDYNGDGHDDLFAIQTNATTSNMVEVHVLDGANNYHSFLLETKTVLPAVYGNFSFLVGDYNSDGHQDIYAIKQNQTGTGTIEVHVMDGYTNYQGYILETGTPLTQAANGVWEFQLNKRLHDPLHGLCAPDLVGILRNNTGTGTVEIQVLDGQGNYQNFINQSGTPLPVSATDNREFLIFDQNHDYLNDFTYILKNNTGTHTTEVHTLDGYCYFRPTCDAGRVANGSDLTDNTPSISTTSSVVSADQMALIYPNPFTDHLTIDTENLSASGNPLQIELINAAGAVVYTNTITQSTTIPAEQLADGMYVLLIKDNGKIIKNVKLNHIH